MARPQFSKMLVDRRRDLGLTLEQAAHVLKMKQQVLTAFEEGDWDRIPRSGYAQGMLSSYSRYLGLNPRHVIDQFKQDLYAYSHSAPDHGGANANTLREQRRLAGYADRYLGQGPGRSAVADDIDLYGSAGPAGSIMSSGTFDDEMYRRLARERGGHRGVGYSERYLEHADDEPVRDERGQRRPYTGRVPDHGSSARRRSRQERSSLAREKAVESTRSTIRTRVIDDRYRDDLRYDPASGYEAASTERGRRDSRHIAEPTRPNVSRGGAGARGRSAQRASGRRDGRGDRDGDRHGRDRGRGGRGDRGRTPSYLSFDARTLALIVVALFVVLMVFVLVAVGSCVNNVTNAEKPQVPVSTAQTEVSGDDGGADAAGADDDADAEGGTGGSRRPAATNLPGTVTRAPDSVTVSVEEGKVSWVEVVMGDVSLVAQTVSGPWQKTYQVTAPMEIQASDASAVRVTADGTPVTFDSKASGVGIITIAGPDPDQVAADSEDGEGEDAVQGQGLSGESASDDGEGGASAPSGGTGAGGSGASTGAGDGSASTGGAY